MGIVTRVGVQPVRGLTSSDEWHAAGWACVGQRVPHTQHPNEKLPFAGSCEGAETAGSGHATDMCPVAGVLGIRGSPFTQACVLLTQQVGTTWLVLCMRLKPATQGLSLAIPFRL